MSMLEERQIACPYCGETISILIDPAGHIAGDDTVQEYIEDCQVCCRPINVTVSVSYDGAAEVYVAHENE